jgi:hypothetical protein
MTLPELKVNNHDVLETEYVLDQAFKNEIILQIGSPFQTMAKLNVPPGER